MLDKIFLNFSKWFSFNPEKFWLYQYTFL